MPAELVGGMPQFIGILLAVFPALCGALILIGLNWRCDVVSHRWAPERFGLMLSVGGFVGYSISVSWYFPESVFLWGAPLALRLGGLLRLVDRDDRALHPQHPS